MIDKFKATFLEEAAELLSQLEDTLLELEASPSDAELINKAFRAMHTVKGSSAMFGFESVSHFTHEVENMLDRCRNGEIRVDRDFIGLTLKARDHIRRLLEFELPPPEVVDEGKPILESIFSRLGDVAATVLGAVESLVTAPPSPPPSPASSPAPVERARESGTWRIAFKPAADIFKDGTKVLNLLEELGDMGEATIYPHLAEVPSLLEIDPERCYCAWDIVLTTDKDRNAIRDVFIFVEDRAVVGVEPVATPSGPPGEAKRLGEIIVERGLVDRSTLGKVLGSRKKIGEALIESQLVSKSEIESALLEQDHLKKLQERKEASGASIRVPSEKLDSLVDLVGELVTLQARLSQTALGQEDGILGSISEQFERLISQLRDNTMSIRMLPIGSTFNKFRRVVRDLSIELGKEAELVTEGAETELDKTVIERLGDPLVHIIRNSLDHGIELPDQRAAIGKPRAGTIRLAARHSGAYVLIQVSDDGNGLDLEAIRRKGQDRGLIAAGQELSDTELFQLIFAPGFSTAKAITTVSGRGVGMDVVKREIDALGGSVQLDSKSGRGTLVTLKLPLTLAIIEGLLVQIGGEFYVIPLSSVDGCIEISRDELAKLGERRILSYRQELVPFAPLRGWFASEGEEPAISQIVIVQAMDTKVGFVVDQVVGDYQTVIKPLGRMFRDVEGLSGATILGDGTVALILDINRLALAVQKEGRERAATKGPDL